MSDYHCGKCDIYRSPGGSFYGKNEDLCPNCLRPLVLVDRCLGCDIEYPTVEGVDGYHSAECKELADGAWLADSLEG